jgi:DNA-binding XRE family transcriptional regulator
MDLWDFKKWRKKLKYSQTEAAEKLGLRRAGLQHWESEKVPISKSVELACDELTERWKQRPEFGPVTLMYADEPVWPGPDHSARRLFALCELYATTEAALQRACWLKASRNFINPLIIGQDGEIIWASPDLLRECERRIENINTKGITDVAHIAANPSPKPPAS